MEALGSVSIESRMTWIYTDGQQGGAWASQACAAFSNPFTSELACDCEIASLAHFASGPAGASRKR